MRVNVAFGGRRPRRARGAALVALWVMLPSPGAAGDVAGRISHAGVPPAPARLEVTKDRPVCGETQPDESLLVSPGGGLANAVVTIEVPGVPARPAPVTLDQQRCRYVPHVLAAQVGSTLEIRSGDPVLHGVHGYLGKGTAFDVPMAHEGKAKPRTLAKPGVIRVACDIHGWMSAWVVVTDSPFHAVTDAEGRFAIAGVPAGAWDAKVWHERLGERRARVTVAEGGTARLEVRFEEAAR